jgi:hypothetical protein
MKMLMIIGPQEREDELRTLLSAHAVHAYSELREVLGEGTTGPHLGTRIWPGRSVLLFAVLPEEQIDGLILALKTWAAGLPPAEGVRAFAVPAETIL